MILACDRDTHAETLHEAFKITKEEYDKIMETVVDVFQKSNSIMEAVEKLARMYGDPCRFTLAVFSLGRLFQGVVMSLERVPLIVMPVAVTQLPQSNRKDLLWG